MYYLKTIQEIADELLTSLESGLKTDEIQKRYEKYGKNKLPEPTRESFLHKIIKQFTDVLVLILIVAAGVSFALGEVLDASVILIIVLVNGVLGYIQEARAERAIEALKGLSTQYAHVLRDGEVKQIDVVDLVPGDIIILESGDKIPADARLTEVIALQVSEAILTGESNPVVKKTDKLDKENLSIGDRVNMVYKDTSVVFGRGKALVVATGKDTEIGKISAMLSDSTREETPLGKELNIVGKRLSGAAIVVIIAIFIIGRFIKGLPLEETFLTAISLAVAAIPEGLPAVVTITLAIGVSKLAKQKAIVRRLQAVETLGSTNYICTDKTGTLTQNKMAATNVLTPSDAYEVITSKNNIKTFVTQKQRAITPQEDERLYKLLLNSLLCNNSEFSIKNKELKILGDPTETALIELVHFAEMDIVKLTSDYKRLYEVPFSSETKRMIVVTRNPQNENEVIVMAKGAAEMVTTMVTDFSASIEEINGIYAKKGLRNLAFSYRVMTKKAFEEAKAAGILDAILTTEHIYLGMISQKDPLRPEEKDAMNMAKSAGMNTIMLTGDHKLTATSIAKEIGLIDSDDETKDGMELGDASDEELAKILRQKKVFARVSPQQKLNIVKALQIQKLTVAVTGDGVNDAPAIKTADIGISMGITGTDVSKEVSDMVLQDDNYATIVKAVEQGRIIYDNLVKFITYLISCNIAEIIVVAAAMIFTPAIPLLPIQILWINLTTDGAPALALSMEPGEKDIMKRLPRARGHLLTRERWTMILLQAILIAIGTFTMFLLGLQVSIAVAQTAAFTTLAMSEMIRSLNNRSERHSVFSRELRPNFTLYWVIIISIAVQLLVVFTDAGNMLLKTQPLTGDFLILSVVMALLPLFGVELYKMTNWNQKK